MKHLTKIFAIAIFASFISVSFAQEENADDHKMHDHKKMEMKEENHHDADMDSTKSGHDMDMKNHKSMKMDKMKSDKNSIVREGEIDLKAIDKNKDGKVYQDMMDWNVISDEPGECPLCKMTLTEVSIEQAKENLIKNDFKIK